MAILADPKEPDNADAILLQSIQYENVGEARQILTYFLEEGMDKNLYKEERKKDRYKYQLKRPTLENDYEVVAESRDFHNEEDREKSFNKTLQVLDRLTEDENFHLIEHILLRPKIGTCRANPKEKSLYRCRFRPQ